jgi:hypothetical protein
MITRVPFFVPNSPGGDHELAYKALAAFAGTSAAPPGERIYSITFISNGETWTATVGQQLKGTGTITKGRGRQRTVREVPLHNGATVLAIFAGHPFLVCHDGASRTWANPFLAGQPRAVVYFAAPSADAGPTAAQEAGEK